MQTEHTTQKRRRDNVAIYIKIAYDIANRIVHGDIPEGKKLSGRSTMSSEYGVSPETIRRSFSLLEEMGVVEVKQNSGVRVASRDKALQFIAKHSNISETRTLISKLKSLMNEQKHVEKEIFEVVKQLVDSSERFVSSNPFYTFECTVEHSSAVVGKSLKEISFWQETKATVIAIRRDGVITLSPGPNLTLYADDTVVLVGDQTAKEAVELLLR
jgi:K+/H+ antiporter YhaU regulatory subunit KhtT